MQRILVIGEGFLGHELVSGLVLDPPFSLQALDIASLHGDRAGLGNLETGENSPRVRVCRHALDVRDASSVREYAARYPAPDVIIHAASSGRQGVEGYQKVYVDGWNNLLGAFPDALPVFCASSSVYAQQEGEVVSEASPAQPVSPTGRILREAEDLVLARGGWVLRLAGLYGESRCRLLDKFLAGEAVIEGAGDRPVNLVHVGDAVAGILATLHYAARGGRFPGGNIVNICDGQALDQNTIYAGLAEIFHRPMPPYGEPDYSRKRGWSVRRVSSDRLKALGWQPRYPDFLAWARTRVSPA